MIGILVIVVVSWILLHFIEGKDLGALGFLPIAKRLKEFSIGFLITTLLCGLVQALEAYWRSSAWILNENITSVIILKSFWWDFKSVLTEELVFRGALLYILIQKIGSVRGVLVSAMVFGVYHWFSFGVLGSIVPMILVFIGTGFMGYAWALAFSKTKSILLPLGLHLGWNFTSNTIFSKGPLGDLVLITKGGTELSDWISLLNFVSGLVIVPLLVLLYVSYFVPDEQEVQL